jgi:DUF1016 N-terminal domain
MYRCANPAIYFSRNQKSVIPSKVWRAADWPARLGNRNLSLSFPRTFESRLHDRNGKPGVPTVKLAKTFFDDIRALIVAARATVARGVDLVQVHTSFEIGRRIVEQEQRGKNRAAHGKEVVKALADRLTLEFGSGFSKSNLEYMRRFYLAYQERQNIAQTVSGQLTDRRKTQTVRAQFESGNPTDQIPQTASGQSAVDAPLHFELVPLCVPPRHQRRERAQLLRNRVGEPELERPRAQTPIR